MLVHKALKAKERELKDAEIEMRRLNKEKSVIEEERKELLKQKAKLELELEEAESRAGTDQENQEVRSLRSTRTCVFLRKYAGC